MIDWLIYALIGAVSGVFSGLLGLGGGIIIVPSLLIIFAIQGVSESISMHMAVVTSLMTISVTSIAAAISHHRQSTINWLWFRRLVPGLVIGGLLGAYFSTLLSGKFLQYGFALYACFVAITIWKTVTLSESKYSGVFLSITGIATLIGSVSALVGIGGGTLIVPYLMSNQQPMPQAIGTSALCCVPIAIAAIIGYSLFETPLDLDTMSWHRGFIHEQAFWGIISTSIIFSMLSARWAKKVPIILLKRLFSLVLLMMAWLLVS